MVLQACRVFPQNRIVSRKSFNFSYEIINIWNEYNYILYQNKSNLSTEYSTRLLSLFVLASHVQQHKQKRDHKRECFVVSALDLMSSCFYSEGDVVHHRSRLSPWIPWCHIQPIFTGDRPWRVQSSTASEHVASWWRGGGCGIRKRATSKNIALHVLSFQRAVTSESRRWNIKTGCQAATNKKSKSSLKCICLFLKWEGVAFGSGTCCWSIRCDLISLNERHPSPCVWQL